MKSNPDEESPTNDPNAHDFALDRIGRIPGVDPGVFDPWIKTATGRCFYLAQPSPADVDIIDIARALSHLCRFTGHCKRLYTVADHSVRVARLVENWTGSHRQAFEALLHDASEAYLGDVNTPLKNTDALAGYRVIEARLQTAIAQRFSVTFQQSDVIKFADKVMLVTEARDLLPEVTDFGHGLDPLPEKIEPWTPEKARIEFLGDFIRFYSSLIPGCEACGVPINSNLRAIVPFDVLGPAASNHCGQCGGGRVLL